MNNIVVKLKRVKLGNRSVFHVKVYFGSSQLDYYTDINISRAALIHRILFMTSDQELVKRYRIRQLEM